MVMTSADPGTVSSKGTVVSCRPLSDLCKVSAAAKSEAAARP